MAQGDFTLFNAFPGDLLNGEHDLGADTIKVALINNTTVPSASTVTPTLSDFTEVTGTNYPNASSNVIASTTVTEPTGGTWMFDGDTIQWTQNAGGPTDIFYAIIYNDTNASKMAIGFIDMTTGGGTPAISLAAGNISINWNASGIFRIS